MIALALLLTLPTPDGWELAASYEKAKGRCAVALFHGLDSSKEEFAPLVTALETRGVSTLAVDLRGHGGSKTGGRSWRGFGHDEWPKLDADVAAAVAELRKRGHKKLGLVGASLGAAAALTRAAEDETVRFVASLSIVHAPDQHSLDRLGKRRLLLLSAPPDKDASTLAKAIQKYRKEQKLPADRLIAPRGHGAQAFEDEATLRAVADWIAAACK